MDKLINIYRLVNGAQTTICAISKENATLYQGIMDKDKVTLSVVTEEPIYLLEGDYILLDGIKYKINRDPEDKQSSEKEHSYEFSLEAPIYTLIDKIYCNKITGSTTVTLTGKLRDFLELLIWNVNYDAVSNPLGIDTGWTIGLCPDTEYMNITMEAVKCRDALNTFADKFGVEYYVSNKTVNYVTHIENETGLAFTQGEGGGLYDIERKNVDDGDLVTRAYIKGGTDNVIPGEGDEKGRLILPEVYLENFSESTRGIEAEVVFSEIHPTFQGVVRAVSGNDNREFLCPEIDFDVAELAVGDEARVNFLTGDLMGKSFEFKWNNDSKKITLIYQEDDLAIIDPSTGSRPNIPSSSKYLRGGELFNFTGIKLGGSYKTNAIAKLREKGVDWLAYYSRKRVKFELNVDYRYLRKNHIELHCGDLIKINVPLHNISKLIRVTAIERNLYTGKLTCTVSNYLDEKWRDKIENQIAEIKSSSTTVNGGYGGATSVTILEKNDEREPSDSNVFSSKRALEEIKDKALSRLNDDTAAGLIAFLKGINIGQFISGILGGNLDAAGNAELNSLIVRLKAEVQSLNVSTHTKTRTLEVLESLSAKLVTSEKVSADQISATLIEAIQIIGDNIIANETVAGKNVTASEKVTGKSLVAKEDISGVTADILDKTKTLNLLVKNLAEIYDLKVSHVATLMGTIVKEYISSESFVSGFAGEGMKIYKALNGDWNMELDNLTVRKIFSVFELVVQRITHQGGMVIRSAAGGKLTKVTDGGTYWRCEHDSTDDFALNDQIICQTFTGVQAKRYWRLVTSAGAGYFNLSKADCEAGSNNPEAGDEVAVLGNRTNTARQKAQIDCAVGENAPYRDDYDNINSYSLVGKLITRTGNLSGITDAVFGVLSGSGLYGTNVYLKGTFRLISGKTVEEAIQDGVDGVQVGGRNLWKDSSTLKAYPKGSDHGNISAWANITEKGITFTRITPINSGNFYFYPFLVPISFKKGDSFTVSFQYRTAQHLFPGIYNYLLAPGTSARIPPSSEWTSFSKTYIAEYDRTLPVDMLFGFSVLEQGIAFDIRLLKLESGNKATDWTPAPEDIENRVTSVETNFEIREQQISSKVTEVTVAAQNAKMSETNASTSATQASSSATTATTKAGDASASATTASSKASEASISASTASSKATAASNSATAASGSATTAANKANDASLSAGAAAGSASSAKTSADAAAVVLSSVTTKESSINQTAGKITLQVSEVTEKVVQANTASQAAQNAAILSSAMSKGKMLFRDASFLTGLNSVSRYNNTAGNALSIERIPGGINSFQIKIKVTSGDTSPDRGGFFQLVTSAPDKIFVSRIIAKIPVGYNLYMTSNATGDGSVHRYLTPTAGTGKWEEYATLVKCGSSGVFSTLNFFYLRGPVPTTEAPLEWFLSYASAFEVTASEIDFIADAAAKYTTKTEFTSYINVLSEQIQLKVAQNDFDALGNRVTAAESSITLLPSQIQSAVSESKTYTDNTVGNIKIGGTNLCANTGFVDNFTNWSSYSALATFAATIINEPTALSGKAIQWKWTKEGSQGGLHLFDRTKLILNEPYTVTCWIKSTIAHTVELRWEGSSNAKRILVEPNVWTLFSFYFIYRGETNNTIHFYYSGGTQAIGTTLAVHSLKMENGTKATSWSPAPEDLKNEIQIGGRNLLPKSNTALTGTSYQIGNAWYVATRDFIVGETLTATIKGNIPGTKLFGIWFNGGSHGGFPLTLVGERLYSAVFQVPAGTSNRYIGIYLRDNQAATDFWEFEWIKLESGNKRTDWSPAPEDVASDIDKAKDDAIDYVDGIQIGGSNLATGTADFDTIDGNIRPNYQAFGPNASFKFRGNVVKQITAPWQGFLLLLEPTSNPTIVSFYARVDAGGSASIRTIAGSLPNSFPNGNVINSLEWKQYYIYFPSGTQFSNASSQGVVEFADLVGKVYYSSVKVELGDKPTDWSPAPEDIANQAIRDAAGKYTTKTEHASSITQLSNSIELKVTKTDFNALDIRVSTAETTITQHTSQIALKASNTDLTALGSRVSQAELKLTPDAINLAVKSQTESIANKAANRTEALVDLRALDPNKYYPITINLNSGNSTPYTITVGRSLASSYGVPAWSTHPSGFSTECVWQSNGNGWGTADTNRIVLRYAFKYTAIPPIGTVGQMGYSSNEYIYVRGGSKYNIVVEGLTGVPITLRTSSFTANTQTIDILDPADIVAPVPDLSTKLAKTEFTAELTVLKDSIATKVSQITFDQLGNTVSNHTTQLTQLPNAIDARITTQTNEGGIIKTKVESWFTMSGNTISLGAKTVNISGATVFNSLATQTQAQGYATAALNTAKGYTDTLQTTLGDMAFQNQVTLAKLDSTIIDGGFLKTTLIAANSITADKLDVTSVRAVVLTTESLQAVRIVTGNIEVTDNALVGGFKVNSYNLANVNNKDCWISVTCNDMYSSRVSSLGNNYPATTGIATAGYFSATGSSRNHALILNATGSTENTDIWGGKSNLAIWATGGVKWKMNQGDHWCMPGVLAVVEIDGWSLALQNRWGNGFSSLGISRGSDKAYAITHNIGHTEYTVLAIPFVTNTDGRWIESIPMYVDKSSTYIKIFFKTGSNDTTLPRYITFVFFGRNGAL